MSASIRNSLSDTTTVEYRILAALHRHVERYDQLFPVTLHDEHWIVPPPKGVRDWFKDRYDYLHAEWVQAINEADNIIGKQWHYDYYIKSVRWGER